MPQMAPIMWLMMFFMFITIFLVFNILNYFNLMKFKNKQEMLKTKKMNMNNNFLNWLW